MAKFPAAITSGFATITKIIPAGMRRASRDLQDAAYERKVVLGDYYGALASAGVWSPSRSRPWPVERAVFEGYERIVWVYKSVETIAGQASGLQFRLKQGKDVLDDHPLYWVLNKHANEMETGPQFRSRLGKQLLLSKRGAFVQVTKARNGTVLRLDLLPPGRTRPVPGSAMSTAADGTPQFHLIDHYEIVRADGTRNDIPADQVIWFREPHPIDPYSGVTPLEAAGMSVELDYFSRLYNTTFMKNDARPGGIIGVGGDMSEPDMIKLEDKFSRGPAEAGKLTVIAGDVSYVDTVTRPRDAQHGETADRAKIETLDAFGVPESMMGNASGKTFDNAGQEGYNFWTITMGPQLNLQVTGFDTLSEPELEGFFDVSHVPALAAAEAAKREEARAEVQAGLISIDDYREATGKDPYGMPATRALVIGNGTTLVPTSAEDQKALGGPLVALGQAPAQGAPGGPAGGGQPAAIGASPSHPAPGHNDTGPAAVGPGQPAGPAANRAAPAGTPAAKAIRAPEPRPAGPAGQGAETWGREVERYGTSDARPAIAASAPARPPARRVVTGCQVKAAPRQPATPPDGSGGDRQDDEDSDRDIADQQAGKLEAGLTAALTAVAAAWAASRVAPDPVKWAADAQAAAAPLLAAAAWEAARRAARAAGGTPADDTGPDARTPEGAAARTAAANAGMMIGTAASGLATRLATASAAGETVDVARQAATWATGIAVQAATMLVNSAADLAASIAAAIAGRLLVRVWRTRRDTRVRDTHRDAQGQRQRPGQPFAVGDALLMYPGDPAGPPEEVYGCRCRLTHRLGRVPA